MPILQSFIFQSAKYSNVINANIIDTQKNGAMHPLNAKFALAITS